MTSINQESKKGGLRNVSPRTSLGLPPAVRRVLGEFEAAAEYGAGIICHAVNNQTRYAVRKGQLGNASRMRRVMAAEAGRLSQQSCRQLLLL